MYSKISSRELGMFNFFFAITTIVFEDIANQLYDCIAKDNGEKQITLRWAISTKTIPYLLE